MGVGGGTLTVSLTIKKTCVFRSSLKGKLFKTKFVLDFTQTLAKIFIEMQPILKRKLWIGRDPPLAPSGTQQSHQNQPQIVTPRSCVVQTLVVMLKSDYSTV